MTGQHRSVVACLLPLLLASCGSDVWLTHESGAATEPLAVSGYFFVDVPPGRAGDLEAANTLLSITLTRGESPMTGATVRVELGSTSLLLTEASRPGVYEAATSGYSPQYRLSVRSGAQALEGILLQGPPLHHVTTPADGARVSSSTPLAVRWSPSGARSAEVAMTNLPEQSMDDTGAFEVPSAILAAGTVRARSDELHVDRSVTVPVPGAAEGSSVLLEVSVRVALRVEAP